MTGANVAIVLLAAIPLALVAGGYYYLQRGTRNQTDRRQERYEQVRKGYSQPDDG